MNDNSFIVFAHDEHELEPLPDGFQFTQAVARKLYSRNWDVGAIWPKREVCRPNGGPKFQMTKVLHRAIVVLNDPRYAEHPKRLEYENPPST